MDKCQYLKICPMAVTHNDKKMCKYNPAKCVRFLGYEKAQVPK